jgi:hypothetical protein
MRGDEEELVERLGQSVAQAILEQARGRRYPQAWASLEASSGSNETAGAENQNVLPRPPPGVASVRPSVRVPTQPERANDDVLAQAADQAFFSKSESGAATFELMISDELFDNLRCSISVGKNGVEAVFYVKGDVDLRRLLESESGRLRASLEAKGLRSVNVRIEDA